jgi:hypothetical protein
MAAAADRIVEAHHVAARAVEQNVCGAAAGAQLSRDLSGQVPIVQRHRVRVAQQQSERGSQLLAARPDRVEALAERRRRARLDVREKCHEAGRHDATQLGGRHAGGAQVGGARRGARLVAQLLQEAVGLSHLDQLVNVGRRLATQRKQVDRRRGGRGRGRER